MAKFRNCCSFQKPRPPATRSLSTCCQDLWGLVRIREPCDSAFWRHWSDSSAHNNLMLCRAAWSVSAIMDPSVSSCRSMVVQVVSLARGGGIRYFFRRVLACIHLGGGQRNAALQTKTSSFVAGADTRPRRRTAWQTEVNLIPVLTTFKV